MKRFNPATDRPATSDETEDYIDECQKRFHHDNFLIRHTRLSAFAGAAVVSSACALANADPKQTFVAESLYGLAYLAAAFGKNFYWRIAQSSLQKSRRVLVRRETGDKDADAQFYVARRRSLPLDVQIEAAAS
ncbi:MAG: hypothetical protein LBM73_02210 [Candidatus Nomurabacteria bacterium]|jgi:hypothetical protein|nr:hypothetical protein [Candidatus Nomurabacteria bacterium]